ncbi:MAG: alpha/beta fold hydrolase [Pseudomonadota bacterium]
MSQLPLQCTLLADGLETRAWTGGPAADDEAVLFVHGSPGSADDFLPLATAASAFARTVVFDMPGFGLAGKPRKREYSVDSGAAFIGRIIDLLGLQRVHLVLHDFGGPWGLTWAARNPARFASVTLIDCGVFPAYRWHRIARIYRTPLLGELFMRVMNRRGFRSALQQDSPRGLPVAFIDRMYDHLDRDTRHAVLALYRNTPDPAAGSTALIDALRTQDRPALVIWGSHDKYLPASLADSQKQAFPRARVHVLDGSGHWPMADNPDAVDALVLPFLREQLAG